MLERHKPASIARRVYAFLLDGFLIQCGFGILAFVGYSAMREGAYSSGLPDPSSDSFDLFLCSLGVLWIFFPFFYFTLFHAWGGQTPAKWIAGIRVVGLRSERVSPFRAAVRTLSYWLSAFPLGAGFLWCLFNPEKRALHDLISGTRVIRLRLGD